jgi:hypothetical protein
LGSDLRIAVLTPFRIKQVTQPKTYPQHLVLVATTGLQILFHSLSTGILSRVHFVPACCFEPLTNVEICSCSSIGSSTYCSVELAPGFLGDLSTMAEKTHCLADGFTRNLQRCPRASLHSNPQSISAYTGQDSRNFPSRPDDGDAFTESPPIRTGTDPAAPLISPRGQSLIIRQPEMRPMEVKGISAGLVIVEMKCVEVLSSTVPYLLYRLNDTLL